MSLGCRLNIAEGETIRGFLAGRDAIVVNSCAVTADAVRQSRAAARRAVRARPDGELIVTGCAATIDATGFAALPGVTRVVPNTAKLDPVAWGSTGPTALAAGGGARVTLGIQTGCDHRCTFCTIPAGRGASRSVPAAAIVARVSALAEAGRQEVVLSGVDMTSWGHDLPGTPMLGALVEALLRDTAIARIRLSSVDPMEIDDRLFALIAGEARVMPHLHLSLQAGDDLVLKRMRRRHLRADAVRLVARLLARRDVAIGADLIAGFPTESEAMFANTLALIDDCAIVHAHVFPYSPRAGTPAARMPQVEPEVRRARAERLRAAAAAARGRWLAGLVGSVQPVLVERPGDRGRAPGFADVRWAAPQPAAIGQVARMRIAAVAAGAGDLTGVPA